LIKVTGGLFGAFAWVFSV